MGTPTPDPPAPSPTPSPTPTSLPSTPGPRRRHRGRWVLGAIALVLVVLVAGWFVFQRLSEPGDPSAFYTPPAKLPAGPPGTIIRSQSLGSLTNGSEAWRVLYTSSAPDGSPIAVSGVVAAPAGAAPDGGWPVVAWAHGTTGVVPAVSPTVPLLVSQGLADTIVRPDITEAFVRAQCAAGAPVELDTYAGIDHFAVRTSAAPKVGAWLLDRLHGKPAPAGCATEQD